jgi:pimeloyl-ACP methyl ester carboxylesterase
MWDDQFQTFAQHYQVMRYDYRGYGKSALPIDDNYTHADDLAALMEHLGIDSAYVVGLSGGGCIAVDFTLSYPEAVDALITVDTTLGGYQWTPRYGALLKSIFTKCGEDQQAGLEAWLDFEIFQAAMEKPAVAARLKEIISDYSGWHWTTGRAWGFLRANNPPTTQRLDEITVPTLIIVGERDSSDFHIIADILLEGILNAQKVVFPGVGHMPNMEVPEEFNRTVLGFLQEI